MEVAVVRLDTLASTGGIESSMLSQLRSYQVRHRGCGKFLYTSVPLFPYYPRHARVRENNDGL
jgi:hypothetical protein